MGPVLAHGSHHDAPRWRPPGVGVGGKQGESEAAGVCQGGHVCPSSSAGMRGLELTGCWSDSQRNNRKCASTRGLVGFSFLLPAFPSLTSPWEFLRQFCKT